MPFVLMVFLTVACVEPWEKPGWIDAPLLSAALTWLATAVAVLTAFGSAQWVRCTLRREPEARDRLLPSYERWRFHHQVLLLGAYGLSLYVFSWGWAVHQFWKWDGWGPLPGVEALILAPFLVGLVLSWVFFYDADRAAFVAAHRLLDAEPFARAFHEPHPAATETAPEPAPEETFGSRWRYVTFQARQKLALVFLPVVLLIVLQETTRLLPKEAVDAWGVWLVSAALVFASAAVAGLPLMIRLVLGLKPLPAGPMRDRLLAASRRLNVRYSEVLLWNTHGAMANAMVVGVVPWLRYVIFTDRLLEEFSPDEVEAVFGHEVGHVKHHHMLYYFSFLLLSMAVMWLTWVVLNAVAAQALAALPAETQAAAKAWLPTGDWLIPGGATLVCAAGLLAYFFVFFGYLSRRCERQADVFGCRAVSCKRPDCDGHGPDVVLALGGDGLCPTGVRTFIRALDKVCQVNGISRDRPGFLQSWQHGSIARRVAFLQSLLRDPAAEPRFQRGVLLVKWGMLAVLGTALAVLLGVGLTGWVG